MHKGLCAREVAELRKIYGFNEITEEETSALLRFVKKFVGPIPIMIEVALVLSMIAGMWEDFALIAMLLILNISVEFFQEKKARNALRALKNTLSPQAMVLRDGIMSTIPARELVPGDIVKLTSGDVVPADMCLLNHEEILVDQSTITGESLPVAKSGDDVIYASSIIQQANVLACVTAIGYQTFIGKSAQLVVQAEHHEGSYFQKAILGIGKFLIVIVMILIAILSVKLFYRGDSLVEIVRFALVLAVASIPVALPAVLSVTMAIGAHALAKGKAIVSNFVVIEDLAGVDRLCVDKTGTLTKNEISIISPKVYDGFSMYDLMVYALLATDKDHRSSIEQAIYIYAKVHNYLSGRNQYTIDQFIPFNPTDKFTMVKVHKNHAQLTILMGAAQVIAQKLRAGNDTKKLLSDVEQFAKNGFRVLAIAKQVDKVMVPVGIIPLLDRPREDSKEVISYMHRRGVIVKMITGDNRLIARYIARILGVGQRIIVATQLHKLYGTNQTSDEARTIAHKDVFAEVTPEDKYNIVSTLQSRNHIVAMTGDGVNDVPALKKADVGIAVSGASPAAQSVADIILLDNGLHIIQDAITTARKTFARMQSYATFRIAETIRIIFFVVLAVWFFDEVPISATMIILLALLNDIPVMAIAYDHASASIKPVRWHLRETVFISSLLGLTGLISSYTLFWWLHDIGASLAIIHTIIFLKLDVSGHSTLYLTRTQRNHFWHKPFPSLKFFVPAFSSRIVGTIMAMYGIFMTPIGWPVVVAIWIYSTVWFVINDYIKVGGYRLVDYYFSHEKQ